MRSNDFNGNNNDDNNDGNDNNDNNDYKGNEKNKITVKVSNLSVKFEEFYAVRNISFSVKEGEIFGFLGANGAGKTTTIRVLCGLFHPSAGSVEVGGTKFTDESGEMKIKKKVGYMSQRFTLYNDLTVEENLSFIASLRGLSSKDYFNRRSFILDFISFQRPLDTFVRDLPGGIKQQVSLAASILHDPEIIFLDEPTSGVTPAMRARFWALIRDLSKLKKTVFVTTHYMDEAEQCDRIALMRSGEIVALDTPERLKNKFFPNEIYEFNPLEQVKYATIKKLEDNPGLEFFEPYGHIFHATFKNTHEGDVLRQELAKNFAIKKIAPSLEDVFIKVIETTNDQEAQGK